MAARKKESNFLDGFLTRSVWLILGLLVGFLFGDVLGKVEAQLSSAQYMIEIQKEDFFNDVGCLSRKPSPEDPEWFLKLAHLC